MIASVQLYLGRAGSSAPVSRPPDALPEAIKRGTPQRLGTMVSGIIEADPPPICSEADTKNRSEFFAHSYRQVDLDGVDPATDILLFLGCSYTKSYKTWTIT